MRSILVLMMVSFLALAGCLEGDSGDEDGDTTTTDTDTPAPEPTLPEDIHDSQMVVGGVNPEGDADQPICSLPTATCIEYPFSVESGKAKLEASLTWTLPAADFDLYLTDADGATVASSISSPPGTSESMSTSVGKGDYTVYVVPYNVPEDTYTLDVTFS